MPLQLTPPDEGVLFVVTGPSGVGKSTLLEGAMMQVPGLEFSVSATTRGPRPGETDGVHYHFVDEAGFRALVEGGALLEHAGVYDRRYGTPREPVERALASGRSVVLDIDVLGARQVRAKRPDAVLVFIAPPSRDVLEARLRARGTDDEATIRRRMELAAGQLEGLPEFDYVVLNDDLDAAHAAFQGVLLAELCRVGRRRSLVQRLLERAR